MTPDPRRSARSSLILFLVLVVLGSVPIQYVVARSGQPIGSMPFYVLALMWMPGLASMVVRLVRRQHVRDVSFRWGSSATTRAVLLVIAYPTLVGLIAYGAAWLTGLAAFQAPSRTLSFQPSSELARFLVRYAFAVLPGIPLSLISALGEEIGWRGFFVLRLVEAGVPKPLLVSGLVWGLWHVPLILTGQYAAGPTPLLSGAVFIISIVPAAYLFAWVRLTTGSLWPAAIGHAAWNSIIQGVFDASTVGSSSAHSTNIWIGESGILVATTSVVLAVLLMRKPFPVLARPGSAPLKELSLASS